MKIDKEIIDEIEEARQHQDFRLEKILLNFTGDVCARMNRLGINRAELAQRLNSSRAFVTQILKCNHNITLKTMDSIAHALGMQLDIKISEIKGQLEVVTNEPRLANNIRVYRPERPQHTFPVSNVGSMFSQGEPYLNLIRSVPKIEECDNNYDYSASLAS